MPIDPVTLRVFGNHAQAAAESMAFTLFRTAHSTFVKETEDFTTGLATPDGQTFASPRELGATWFVGLDYGHAGQMTLDEITGGSPYGASTIAGGDGSRQPSENELKGARYQGRVVAETAIKLHG